MKAAKMHSFAWLSAQLRYHAESLTWIPARRSFIPVFPNICQQASSLLCLQWLQSLLKLFACLCFHRVALTASLMWVTMEIFQSNPVFIVGYMFLIFYMFLEIFFYFLYLRMEGIMGSLGKFRHIFGQQLQLFLEGPNVPRLSETYSAFYKTWV